MRQDIVLTKAEARALLHGAVYMLTVGSLRMGLRCDDDDGVRPRRQETEEDTSTPTERRMWSDTQKRRILEKVHAKFRGKFRAASRALKINESVLRAWEKKLAKKKES